MKVAATPVEGIVSAEFAADIAILTIDHPPINALNLTVRSLLFQLVGEAMKTPMYVPLSSKAGVSISSPAPTSVSSIMSRGRRC